MADLIDMKRSESGRKTTCWLVWSISSRTGLTAIRAIASTQKIAMRYVKGVKQSPDCIKAWPNRGTLTISTPKPKRVGSTRSTGGICTTWRHNFL